MAIVDRPAMIGGVSVHTGTIPSNSIREAIFQLTRSGSGSPHRQRHDSSSEISLADVAARVAEIVVRETGVIRQQLTRNGIVIYQGDASFADPFTINIHRDSMAEAVTQLWPKNVLIACGTRPAQNLEIPFEDRRVVDTDHLHSLAGGCTLTR